MRKYLSPGKTYLKNVQCKNGDKIITHFPEASGCSENIADVLLDERDACYAVRLIALKSSGPQMLKLEELGYLKAAGFSLLQPHNHEGCRAQFEAFAPECPVS
jgi:hypothetical protein